MRALTSFILTTLILVNLFGFYAIFVFKQADIKHEMAEQINSRNATENRQILHFDKAEFAGLLFNDGGSEFRYNGRLYDVVSIHHSAGNVTVVVEYDAGETALVDNFGSLFSQQQDKDQSSSPVKNIISHFQQDYVITHVRILSLNNASVTGYNSVNQSYPVSCFIADKLAPPPQFFLV